MWNLKLARVHNLFHRLDDDDDVFIYIYKFVNVVTYNITFTAYSGGF